MGLTGILLSVGTTDRSQKNLNAKGLESFRGGSQSFLSELGFLGLMGLTGILLSGGTTDRRGEY